MCYAIPLAGSAITSLIWLKTRNIKIWWLSLLFYGGTLTGVIDHLFSGELSLNSKNISNDILSGLTILLSILLTWGFICLRNRPKQGLPCKNT